MHRERGADGRVGALQTRETACTGSWIQRSAADLADLVLVAVSWQRVHQGGALDGRPNDGENRLTVRVANSWHNRIVSDSKLASKDRVTRIADPSVYESPFIRNKPLSPSGLIGPVKLRAAK